MAKTLSGVRPSLVGYSNLTSSKSELYELYNTDDETSVFTVTNSSRCAFLGGFDFSSIPENAKITNISVTMKGRGYNSTAVIMYARLVKNHTGSGSSEYTDLGDGQKQFWKGTTLVTKTIDFPSATAACTVDFLKSGGLYVRVNQNSGRHLLYAVYLNVTYEMPSVTYTYVDYDGTVLKTQTVEEGTSPIAPSNPTRPSTAEYTYTFSGWKLSGTTYTAQYTATKRSYTITTSVSPTEAGTVAGGGTYEYGTIKNLTATANSGYEFAEWNDGVKTASRNITVTENASYTAVFKKVTLPEISSVRITPNPCEAGQGFIISVGFTE